MKTAYARPKLLKEAHFHYCPGCGHGIINRLLMEVIEEMDLQGDAICVAPALSLIHISEPTRPY